jgi:endonuclease YncB( thermonuclease family)
MLRFFKRLVIEVGDADTIKSNGKTYRLMGYDAPEIIRAKSDHERALGKRAAERLRELVAPPNKVKLKPSGELDRYNRYLAQLFINGRDVKLIAIEEGWGVPFNGEKRKQRPDWSGMNF